MRDDCQAIVRRLLSDCATIAKRLRDDCQAIAKVSHSDCAATVNSLRSVCKALSLSQVALCRTLRDQLPNSPTHSNLFLTLPALDRFARRPADLRPARHGAGHPAAAAARARRALFARLHAQHTGTLFALNTRSNLLA
jgi:hypothetical protein